MNYRNNKPNRKPNSKNSKGQSNQRRSGFKKSTLAPSLFINKGVLSDEKEYVSERIYDEMPIDSR